MFRKVALSLFLICITLECFSQKSSYATFTFKGIDKNSKVSQAYSYVYDTIRVTVNGVKLRQKNKAYYVVPHRHSLDTIKIYRLPGSESVSVIITRLKGGENYTVTPNACSLYEIGPVIREDKAGCIRVVVVNNPKRILYLLQNLGGYQKLDTLLVADSTMYYYVPTSGYCPFATSYSGICTSEPLDDGRIPKTDTCSSILIQFMAGEKYTLIYNYKTRKLSAKFDNYYSAKDSSLVKQQ